MPKYVDDRFLTDLLLEQIEKVVADIKTGRAVVYSVDFYAPPTEMGATNWSFSYTLIQGPPTIRVTDLCEDDHAD
jgi:hypothetical protein